MQFYEASLNGMKQVLHAAGKTACENCIEECITEWNTTRTTEKLNAAFKKGGLFEDFAFTPSDIAGEEERFWYTQLFGGLVAMALQLARFQQDGRVVTIEFIRKNFGLPSDVISGTRCQNCGCREINRTDIDRYITPRVIGQAIADGLEDGSLSEKISEVLALTYPPLAAARAEAMARALHSNVSVSDSRTPITICKRCGSKDMAKCRFLRHTKEPSFVALSR